ISSIVRRRPSTSTRDPSLVEPLSAITSARSSTSGTSSPRRSRRWGTVNEPGTALARSAREDIPNFFGDHGLYFGVGAHSVEGRKHLALDLLHRLDTDHALQGSCGFSGAYISGHGAREGDIHHPP